MINSKEIYNKAAENYSDISAKRNNYNNRINEIIIENAGSPKSYLDVGCGDGERSLLIFKNVGAKTAVFIDDSEEMINKNKTSDIVNVIKSSVLDFNSDRRFDLITCLWNVLGHIEKFEDREKALFIMKNHLTEKGKIILDVNNRYNVKNYGFVNILKNYWKDLLKKDSGWFEFNYENYKSKVYIHNLKEIKELVINSGLIIEKMLFVNYKTGELMKNSYAGQIVAILKRKS